jgi:hypothetical protein
VEINGSRSNNRRLWVCRLPVSRHYLSIVVICRFLLECLFLVMRRMGLARNPVRSALCSDASPGFRCPERPSKLDPFKEEIHELLRGDPSLPGVGFGS